jgi:hypothetical protein
MLTQSGAQNKWVQQTFLPRGLPLPRSALLLLPFRGSRCPRLPPGGLASVQRFAPLHTGSLGLHRTEWASTRQEQTEVGVAGAPRSPGVQPYRIGVFDDGCALHHRVRDAQRPRCPFQARHATRTSRRRVMLNKNVLLRDLCSSETGTSILHVLVTLHVSVRVWGAS